MKKTHIIGLIVIAIAMTIIIVTADSSSAYVSFKEAYKLAQNGEDDKIHVVGVLKKDLKGEITGIEVGKDKLSFSFIMIDKNGEEQKVFYNEPMPTDLVRSEQVVVVGAYHNELFIADQILLKCPSKYQEEKLSE